MRQQTHQSGEGDLILKVYQPQWPNILIRRMRTHGFDREHVGRVLHPKRFKAHMRGLHSPRGTVFCIPWAHRPRPRRGRTGRSLPQSAVSSPATSSNQGSGTSNTVHSHLPTSISCFFSSSFLRLRMFSSSSREPRTLPPARCKRVFHVLQASTPPIRNPYRQTSPIQQTAVTMVACCKGQPASERARHTLPTPLQEAQTKSHLLPHLAL